MGDDLRDLGFTVLQMVNNQSSRVCLPCSNLVISLQAGFFLLKPAFKKVCTTMIAFGTECPQALWFCGKVMQSLKC